MAISQARLQMALALGRSKRHGPVSSENKGDGGDYGDARGDAAYQKCAAETVQRFGFLAKYMGDGVLVYFGYPQAHKDDAERAVRAGLALIEAVGKLSSVEPLQIRIGVGIAAFASRFQEL